MIAGVGIDVVEIARLGSGPARTQRLAVRLFTERERDLPLRSLAARFAAKEAPAKALGAPHGWHVSLSHDGGVATAVVIAEGGAD
jgi:holo-[acyl-carrier protein] synthase